jgi:hypothetical protein
VPSLTHFWIFFYMLLNLSWIWKNI